MIAVLLNAGYILLLLWYRHHWRTADELPEIKYPSDALPDITVVVPFRNEAPRLPALIAALHQVQYPQHKVSWIFVDDHSRDGGVELLLQWSAGQHNIRLLSLQEGEGVGKKAALRKGIECASTDWVVTTDADCIPAPGWLYALLNTARNREADMVCGTVKVDERQGGALVNFQCMETAVLQTCGAGSLQAGHPLLNTGASLAFRKEIWTRIGGYSSHRQISSGDDTFLMMAFHRLPEVYVAPCVSAEGMVLTHPASGWLALLRQRLRWNGKLRYYRPGYIHLIGLLVFGAATSWLYLLGLSAFGDGSLFDALLVLALRTYGEYAILQQWEDTSGQKFSLPAICLMSVTYPVFTLLSVVFRPFIRSEWKGRLVNKTA